MADCAPKRERDPICDVCGHCHVQGVKCTICGHVGKYIVPGGPNKPNRGSIPPVPPGPVNAPNRTPPTIEGVTVSEFSAVLTSFFELLPQAEQSGVVLPPELTNIDQLSVLLEALPDYCQEDEQPSYVLAIPCRPVVLALSQLIPSIPCWSHVDWAAIAASSAASQAFVDLPAWQTAGGAGGIACPAAIPRRAPSTGAGPSCSSPAHQPAAF